jgi:hypothetical protein
MHASKPVPAIRRVFSFADSCYHQPRSVIYAANDTDTSLYRMTSVRGRISVWEVSNRRLREDSCFILADLSPA